MSRTSTLDRQKVEQPNTKLLGPILDSTLSSEDLRAALPQPSLLRCRAKLLEDHIRIVSSMLLGRNVESSNMVLAEARRTVRFASLIDGLFEALL